MHLKTISLCVLGTYLGGLAMLTYGLILQNDSYALQQGKNKTYSTSLEHRLARFTGDQNIAEVLVTTKYPKTLAAIAKVESDFRPQVVGDSGKSVGLYQIQPRHWGRFDMSLEGQTRKAEQVFDSLVKEHGYTKAIERWNGQGVKAKYYRNRVVLAMEEI